MTTSLRDAPGTRIVRAGAQDAFVVAALSLQHALAVHVEREDGYLDRAADHWLRHRERLPTWIAERAGAHAGYLQASLVPAPTWPGVPTGTDGRLWIHALYVASDQRRRGVATALLAACESWAKGAGAAVVRLRCEEGAEGFCDASGYAPAQGVHEKRL